MKRKYKTLALVAGFSLALPSMVMADESAGKAEYMENCAVCHGVDGTGNGPFAKHLMDGVTPDLTMLQKNNGDVFPVDQVRKIIDGRTDVEKHGPRDMPVWGNEYNAKVPAPDYFMSGEIEVDAEVFIAGRVMLLVDYLESIQQK